MRAGKINCFLTKMFYMSVTVLVYFPSMLCLDEEEIGYFQGPIIVCAVIGVLLHSAKSMLSNDNKMNLLNHCKKVSFCLLHLCGVYTCSFDSKIFGLFLSTDQ